MESIPQHPASCQALVDVTITDGVDSRRKATRCCALREFPNPLSSHEGQSQARRYMRNTGQQASEKSCLQTLSAILHDKRHSALIWLSQTSGAIWDFLWDALHFPQEQCCCCHKSTSMKQKWPTFSAHLAGTGPTWTALLPDG